MFLLYLRESSYLLLANGDCGDVKIWVFVCLISLYEFFWIFVGIMHVCPSFYACLLCVCVCVWFLYISLCESLCICVYNACMCVCVCVGGGESVYGVYVCECCACACQKEISLSVAPLQCSRKCKRALASSYLIPIDKCGSLNKRKICFLKNKKFQ